MLQRMKDDDGASGFKAAFTSRTQELRERRGFSQREMAVALGVETSAYAKYESRSFLPHHLIPRFCAICNISADEIFGLGARSRPLAHKHQATRR